MSVEAIVKKKGRPKKVVVEEAAVSVGAGDVPEAGINPPAPKARAKTTAKKSASTPTSLSLQSKSTTTTRVEQSLQDADLVDAVEQKVPVVSKRKAAPVKSARAASSAIPSKVKVADTTSVPQATRPRKTTIERKSEASSIDSAPSLERKEAARLEIPTPAAFSESSPQISSKARAQTIVSTRKSALSSHHEVSRILQQAKAFSRQSDELVLELAELVDQRQTASSNHIEVQNSLAEVSTELDGAPLPAEHPHLLVESAVRTTASQPSPSSFATTSSTQTPPRTVQPTYANTPPEPKTSPPPPTVMPFGFRTPPTPQVRAYSSTSPLPLSTTLALAARQVRTNLPPPPVGPAPPMEPRHPTPFTTPAEIGPRPQKLSEMPLEQLKKDPLYRKTAFRYTAAIVAMPFLIVSSWMLWEKCELPLADPPDFWWKRKC